MDVFELFGYFKRQIKKISPGQKRQIGLYRIPERSDDILR
jgi:hypothetical protein